MSASNKIIFSLTQNLSSAEQATARHNMGIDLLVPTPEAADNGKVLKVTDAQGHIGWGAASGGGSTDFVLTDEVIHNVTSTEANNKRVAITIDTSTTFVQGQFSKLVSANAIVMAQIASANQLGSEFVRTFLSVRQFTTGGGESSGEVGYCSLIKSINDTTSNLTVSFPMGFLHDLSRFDFELAFPSTVNIYESLRFGMRFRAYILP